MAEAFKVIAQLNPPANAFTLFYKVPLATRVIVSSLTIANLGAADARFYVLLRPPGGTGWLYYNTVLPANGTIIMTAGLTLQASTQWDVLASTATVAFGLYGTVIT